MFNKAVACNQCAKKIYITAFEKKLIGGTWNSHLTSFNFSTSTPYFMFSTCDLALFTCAACFSNFCVVRDLACFFGFTFNLIKLC